MNKSTEVENFSPSVDKKFVYQPLDSNQSSIRLAVLLPGEQSPVQVRLRHAKFSSRPKYVALSYTWGSPDHLCTLLLDGKEVQVRQNLWDALYYLRDPVISKTFWVDAICIDQFNLAERNQQVNIMSYIYQRAEHVVVWLGEISNVPKSQVKMDNKITRAELPLLCNSPYWKRVWIVQEIGAAAGIEIHWAVPAYVPLAHRTVPWDVFFNLLTQYDIETRLPRKLWAQRDGRHGDAFLLTNLMTACRESLCEDPRDKIYGFVGIAHDCQDGNFPVDYSKSLYGVYQDVIKFHYATSAGVEGKEHTGVVACSQLTQELLGGLEALDEDLRMRQEKTKPLFRYAGQEPKDETDLLTISGLFAGRISTLGPYYEEVIGEPSAMRAWKMSLTKCKTGLEALRKKSEGFMRLVLEMEEKDFRKVSPRPTVFPIEISDRLRTQLEMEKKAPEEEEAEPKEGSLWQRLLPAATHRIVEDIDTRCRLFSTEKGVIGLVPSNTRLEDFIVQFLDSDVVAVVRVDAEDDNFCHIVGRGVIASKSWNGKQEFQTPLDMDHIRGDGRGDYMKFSGATVPLKVDLMTLHLMTC